MAGKTTRGAQSSHGTQPETVAMEPRPEVVALAGNDNPVRENADYPTEDHGDPDSIAAFKRKMADPAIRAKYGIKDDV